MGAKKKKPAMRVVLEFNPATAGVSGGASVMGRESKTSKLSIPASWVSKSKSVGAVIALFVDAYNAKLGAGEGPAAAATEGKAQPEDEGDADEEVPAVQPLCTAALHLRSAIGDRIASNQPIGHALQDGATYTLHDGVYGPDDPESEEVRQANALLSGGDPAAEVGELCKNPGCRMRFLEEDNNDEACLYHAQPPMIRDISKTWGCCGKTSTDWEDFMAFPGCVRGRHSSVAQQTAFAPSPTVEAAAAAADAAPAPVIKSIAAFDEENPDAVTAASSLQKSMQKPRKCTLREDGTARCLRCGTDFVASENTSTSCRYHPGQFGVQDSRKWFDCCQKSSFDLEELLRDGCTEGFHDYGAEAAETNPPPAPEAAVEGS